MNGVNTDQNAPLVPTDRRLGITPYDLGADAQLSAKIVNSHEVSGFLSFKYNRNSGESEERY